MLREVRKRLRELANPERAKMSLRYFKTLPGDRFLGNTVPDLRKLSKQYRQLPFQQILELLHSSIHEERVLALLILNLRFSHGSEAERKKIHNLYLRSSRWINNWDLVDCSAPLLIGEYLLNKDPSILDTLARSRNLWKRRTAMVATLAFIRKNRLDVPLKIATALLRDPEDLIHKATGWMLREVGKKSPLSLEDFLAKHASQMSRTTLRYAIERFPEYRRKEYLTKTISPSRSS
jgi:3-methyladenine DNA glycosylase AlkD